jgi:hypothetical protein
MTDPRQSGAIAGDCLIMSIRFTFVLMALFASSAGWKPNAGQAGSNVAAEDFDAVMEAQLRKDAYAPYMSVRDPISVRNFVEPACRYEVENAAAILRVLQLGWRDESLRRDMLSSGHPTHIPDFIATHTAFRESGLYLASEAIVKAVDKACRDATARIVREFEAESRKP